MHFFFLADVILTDTFIGYLVGNTLWLIAVGYYIYVTFLGYSGKFWWFKNVTGKSIDVAVDLQGPVRLHMTFIISQIFSP